MNVSVLFPACCSGFDLQLAPPASTRNVAACVCVPVRDYKSRKMLQVQLKLPNLTHVQFAVRLPALKCCSATLKKKNSHMWTQRQKID